MFCLLSIAQKHQPMSLQTIDCSSLKGFPNLEGSILTSRWLTLLLVIQLIPFKSTKAFFWNCSQRTKSSKHSQFPLKAELNFVSEIHQLKVKSFFAVKTFDYLTELANVLCSCLFPHLAIIDLTLQSFSSIILLDPR